jgi:hypothetical protein
VRGCDQERMQGSKSLRQRELVDVNGIIDGEAITYHNLTSQYLSIVQEGLARLQKLTIHSPVRVDDPSIGQVSQILHL